MTIPARPEDPLTRELRLFMDGSVQLISAYLNRFFDVSPRQARRRLWSFIILFLLCGFLLSLRNYPLDKWIPYFQDLFVYAINSAYRASHPGNPFLNLIAFSWTVFKDPRNFRYVPLLLAPFFISLQSAAIYLADIFNLQSVAIARKHIREVALGGSDETIRITKGEIAEEHRDSPNYLIGGPGKMIVDLDSVVVLERPDGTPRVVGPTGKDRNGKATIHGFERIREAFDLRDHTIDLRDRNPKSSSVTSRSKDGISVSATDVRFTFSVDRNGVLPVADSPYPFSVRAVRNLVYNAISQVSTELDTPSVYKFHWVNNMTNLIRGELIAFMNRRKLVEYLASFGIPERERAIQREVEFTAQMQNLLTAGDAMPNPPIIPPLPGFIPRPTITNLFTEFEREFANSARNRGVVLKWIGIGAWKTPVEKVINEHLEAWKLSQINRKASDQDTFDELTRQSMVGRFISLIQDIPLGSFHQIVSRTRSTRPVIRSVLTDYRKQLIQARDLWTSRGEIPPQVIIQAIRIMDGILGHFIGGI